MPPQSTSSQYRLAVGPADLITNSSNKQRNTSLSGRKCSRSRKLEADRSENCEQFSSQHQEIQSSSFFCTAAHVCQAAQSCQILTLNLRIFFVLCQFQVPNMTTPTPITPEEVEDLREAFAKIGKWTDGSYCHFLLWFWFRKNQKGTGASETSKHAKLWILWMCNSPLTSFIFMTLTITLAFCTFGFCTLLIIFIVYILFYLYITVYICTPSYFALQLLHNNFPQDK